MVVTNELIGQAVVGLADLSQQLAQLVERVRAGVVQVSDGRGAGAGTIWSTEGIIVTNYHVAPGERAWVMLEEGTELRARVVRNLPERDLAILKVDAEGLPALPVGDSTAMRPGELVLAVGNPLGARGAASIGIYSGTGTVEGRPGKHIREALRADVVLLPGNSGGPLVNVRGEVVGINAMVMGPSTALAVPSETVTRLLTAERRRKLGVSIGIVPNPSVSGSHDAALIVLDVIPGSLAARIGLLPGDILLTLGGQAIEEPGDIAWIMMDATDQVLTITVLRGGREITLEG